MAYSSSSNPLFLIVGRTGGSVNPGSSATGALGGQIFGYNSTDLAGTVAAVGYFTDAYKWGARTGDSLLLTSYSTAATAVYVGHANGRFSNVTSTGGTVVFVSSST